MTPVTIATIASLFKLSAGVLVSDEDNKDCSISRGSTQNILGIRRLHLEREGDSDRENEDRGG
jgi:hypothetical protein